ADRSDKEGHGSRVAPNSLLAKRMSEEMLTEISYSARVLRQIISITSAVIHISSCLKRSLSSLRRIPVQGSGVVEERFFGRRRAAAHLRPYRLHSRQESGCARHRRTGYHLQLGGRASQLFKERG